MRDKRKRAKNASTTVKIASAVVTLVAVITLAVARGFTMAGAPSAAAVDDAGV